MPSSSRDDVVLPQGVHELLVKLDAIDTHFSTLTGRVESLNASLEARLNRLEAFANAAQQRGEQGAQSIHWAELHMKQMNESLQRIAWVAGELLRRSVPDPLVAAVTAAGGGAPEPSDEESGEEWRPHRPRHRHGRN